VAFQLWKLVTYALKGSQWSHCLRSSGAV